jgi:hypothetical protein
MSALSNDFSQNGGDLGRQSAHRAAPTALQRLPGAGLPWHRRKIGAPVDQAVVVAMWMDPPF